MYNTFLNINKIAFRPYRLIRGFVVLKIKNVISFGFALQMHFVLCA